jgi:hypothetical protein
MGAEDDEELYGGDPKDEVVYDEIDSSRTIDEVEALILQKPGHLEGEPGAESNHGDVHIVGAHVERYTGYEFSSCTATSWWMAWDATSHM